MNFSNLVSRIALALGIGLLIGVERDWRTREAQPGSRAAGIRTFAISRLRRTDMIRIVLATASACIATLFIFAQARSNAQQEQTQRTSEAYTPDVGDLMSATQLRHFKLSFAGTTGNWELANYELGQVRKNFATAARLYPTLNGLPLAQLIQTESEPPLTDIAKAIDAKTLAIVAIRLLA